MKVIAYLSHYLYNIYTSRSSYYVEILLTKYYAVDIMAGCLITNDNNNFSCCTSIESRDQGRSVVSTSVLYRPRKVFYVVIMTSDSEWLLFLSAFIVMVISH